MLLPPSLLRSCITFEGDAVDETAQNLRVITSELELEGVDGYLLTHLADIYSTSAQVPTFDQVREWCVREEMQGDARGSVAQTRLDGLPEAEFIAGSTFRYSLNAFKTDLQKEALSTALVEASTILMTGVQTQVREGREWKPKLLQGPDAAVESLMVRLAGVNRQLRRGGVDGEVRADTSRYQREMTRRAAIGQGVLSGISIIDSTHFGLMPGQLAFILGFTGQLKSTFCFNWAYRAAINQGKNVAVISLEMSAFALQTALLLMHTSHPKFEQEKVGLVIKADKIKTGGFEPEETTFLTRVLEDLNTCPDYGRIFYRESQSTATTIADIQSWAERIHRDNPLDLLVIDYLGLVDLSKSASGMEQSSYLNQVVRQTKLFANSFGNGRGIPILSPFQSNRAGYADAEKSGGRFKLTAMNWSNEAEKSADLVYSVFMDADLIATSEVILGNCKVRDGKQFMDLVRLFVDPDSRVIQDLVGFGGNISIGNGAGLDQTMDFGA